MEDQAHLRKILEPFKDDLILAQVKEALNQQIFILHRDKQGTIIMEEEATTPQEIRRALLLPKNEVRTLRGKPNMMAVKDLLDRYYGTATQTMKITQTFDPNSASMKEKRHKSDSLLSGLVKEYGPTEY